MLLIGLMGAVRFLLALSVVFWHTGGDSPIKLLNAGVAVLCFFIVSGFYMAMVINEKYRTDVRAFYTARVWRLAPTYLLILFLAVIWFWWIGQPNVFTSRAPTTAAEQLTLALMNCLVIGQDLFQLVIVGMEQKTGAAPLAAVQSLLSPSYFEGRWMVIGQAWSLSSEIMFYAVAPFIVMSPVRIAVLLVASLIVRYVLIEAVGLRSGIWGYWFFPTTLAFFLMGAAAYHLHAAPLLRKWAPAIGWLALGAITAWFATIASLYQIVLPSPADWSLDRPHHWVAYVLFALSIPPIFAATREIALDRWLGDLSYPLYLVHGFTLGLVFAYWGGDRRNWMVLGFAILFSLLAAVAFSFRPRSFVRRSVARDAMGRAQSAST